MFLDGFGARGSGEFSQLPQPTHAKRRGVGNRGFVAASGSIDGLCAGSGSSVDARRQPATLR